MLTNSNLTILIYIYIYIRYSDIYLMLGKCSDSLCSPYIYIPTHLSAGRAAYNPDTYYPCLHGNNWYEDAFPEYLFPVQGRRCQEVRSVKLEYI